jgi:hypothetical protein
VLYEVLVSIIFLLYEVLVSIFLASIFYSVCCDLIISKEIHKVVIYLGVGDQKINRIVTYVEVPSYYMDILLLKMGSSPSFGSWLSLD